MYYNLDSVKVPTPKLPTPKTEIKPEPKPKPAPKPEPIIEKTPPVVSKPEPVEKIGSYKWTREEYEKHVKIWYIFILDNPTISYYIEL